MLRTRRTFLRDSWRKRTHIALKLFYSSVRSVRKKRKWPSHHQLCTTKSARKHPNTQYEYVPHVTPSYLKNTKDRTRKVLAKTIRVSPTSRLASLTASSCSHHSPQGSHHSQQRQLPGAAYLQPHCGQTAEARQLADSSGKMPLPNENLQGLRRCRCNNNRWCARCATDCGCSTAVSHLLSTHTPVNHCILRI